MYILRVYNTFTQKGKGVTTVETLAQDHTVTAIREAKENPDSPLKCNLEWYYDTYW